MVFTRVSPILKTCPVLLVFSSWLAGAAVTGRIAGTVKDPTGAVVPGGVVTVTNTAQGIETRTVTSEKGVYAFPSLPVGRYDIKVEVAGFKPATRTDLTLDIDSALQIDFTLEIAQKIEEVTVTESEAGLEVRVET